MAVCCLHGNVIAKVVADRAKLLLPLLLAASACGIYLSLRNACKISETIGSLKPPETDQFLSAANGGDAVANATTFDKNVGLSQLLLPADDQ